MHQEKLEVEQAYDDAMAMTMVGELGINAEGIICFSLPAVLKPCYMYTLSGTKDPRAPVTCMSGDTPTSQVHRTEGLSMFV